jgi:PadR family transcriptional regulator PadR
VDQERRAQWLRGVLDLCVLAVLCRGTTYGYELSQSLEAAGFGPVQGGTLYPVLLRLERSGLVTTHWQHGPSGPARKYYEISEAGRETLRTAGSQWRFFAGTVSSILKEADL